MHLPIKNRKGQMAALSLVVLLPISVAFILLASYVGVRLGDAVSESSRDVAAMSREGKHILEIRIRPIIDNSTGTVVYRSRVCILNKHYSSISFDYLAVFKKGHRISLEKPIFFRLRPSENITVKPSTLDPSLSVYDDDYFGFKKDVEYLLFHTVQAGVFMSSWGGIG